MTDAQWTAAHARLMAARKTYLRGTRDALWGRPPSGTASKYLLTGIGRCGVCGGGLAVRSRAHGGRRSFRYVCASHHYRGAAVCANGWELHQEVADAAALSMAERDVLHPEVIERAVTIAVEAALADRPADRRADIAKQIQRLEGELRQLTAAIAGGGSFASLIAGLHERETALAALKAEDERLRLEASRTPRDRKALERAVRTRLANLRELLHRHVHEARVVLQIVLEDRLVFTPQVPAEPDGPRKYMVRGRFAIGRIVEEILSSTYGVPDRSRYGVYRRTRTNG